MRERPDYRDSHLTIHVWVEDGDGELRARIRPGRPAVTRQAARGEDEILVLVRDALRTVQRRLQG